MEKFKIYLKSILIPVIVGGVVGFLISGSMDYDLLQKPFLAPPALTFPIVWTILYILMGVSYSILKEKEVIDNKVSAIYYIQLAVNAIWPIIFFILKWRFVAFLWILLLVFLVILMSIKFYSKNKLAGLLQVPYIIWTLFATYLNLGIYLLNK